MFQYIPSKLNGHFIRQELIIEMRYPNVTWRIILPVYLFTTELLQHTCSSIIFLPERDLRYIRVFAVAIPSVVCRLSVVCNVGAPYSGGWSFRQNFFTAVYAGHPLTSVQNFTDR